MHWMKVGSAKFYQLVAKGVDGIQAELVQLASVFDDSERTEIIQWTNYIL